MFVPAFPPLGAARRSSRRRIWRTEDVFPGAHLFARGRFALFEGMRALAAVRGIRRVWLPAYLCRPVVDVTDALGLATALYDVDERLEPVWATLEPARGDALLVVHYFGLALERTPVQEFCTAYDMPLVEDCAHTVPDPGADVRVGSYGALGVFSLRKQAPVPGGGFLVVGDPAVGAAVCAPRAAGMGDRRTLLKLGIMLGERVAYAAGCNVLPFKDRLPVLDAHRAAHTETATRAVATTEFGRPPAPAFFLGPLLRRLDWRRPIQARQHGYRHLAAQLRDVPGVTVPVLTPAPGSVPQALPLWVDDPDRVVRRLRRRGVEAMRWPGREQVPFAAAECPGTVGWLERSLILPLGCALTPARLAAVVQAVRDGVGVPAL